MARRRFRRIVSAVCGTLGILLIFLAVLIGYARRSLFDERAFSARVAASLADPRVAELAAEKLTDALIDANPDLVGVRPLLIGVCRSVVSSPPFRAAVRRSARALHHSITTGQARDIVLTVKDAGALFESVAATQPGVAKKIPPGVTAAIGRLESLPGGERIAWLVRFANRVRAMAIGLLLLGMALCTASVWLSSEKRRAIVRLGIALTCLGLVLAILARFGGDLLSLFARHAELAPVVAGLGSAFLGGLMIWAIGLGFAGLVLSAASASFLERVPLHAWANGARRWLIGPQPRMRFRLARGGLGAAAGATMLLWPLQSLTVAGWLSGLVLAFAGLREAFVAMLHLLPQFEPRMRGQKESERRTSRGRAIALAGGFAIVLIAATVWLILRSPDTPPVAEAEAIAYNGSTELGERRLDQVVFPTTHNSMGSGDLSNWMLPNQSAGIKSQLEDGIRAFMIDIHYGVPAGDYVKSQISGEAAAMAKYEAEVGREALEAAMRIRDRLTGKETGERDLYMCHGFCELGSLKLVPVLGEVRDFLVANPGEVLVFVLQDEEIAAQDIVQCFEKSGLIDFVYRGPARPPWPTLREMVTTDQRVVVLTENLSEGIDWCHPAFEVLQETPYTFHDPSEFSNRPNRGKAGGSLLLMNHWIESTPMPKPSNAGIVNAREVLLKRIRAFQRERGGVPNLVAVDFYREGDLIAVVRELNATPLKDLRIGARGREGSGGRRRSGG